MTRDHLNPMFTKEMQRALEADGEKLRQLTGEDHGPVFLKEPPEQWVVCEDCNGSGVHAYRITVYEAGCGFPHDDTAEKPCVWCGGAGGWIDDAESDHQ